MLSVKECTRDLYPTFFVVSICSKLDADKVKTRRTIKSDIAPPTGWKANSKSKSKWPYSFSFLILPFTIFSNIVILKSNNTLFMYLIRRLWNREKLFFLEIQRYFWHVMLDISYVKNAYACFSQEDKWNRNKIRPNKVYGVICTMILVTKNALF